MTFPQVSLIQCVYRMIKVSYAAAPFPVQDWNITITVNMKMEIVTMVTLNLLVGFVIMNGNQNFVDYYTCYYNKYFNVSSDMKHDEREAFVKDVVEDAIENSANIPSDNCVQWICDDRVIWTITRDGSSEVLSYYAQKNTSISSWQACLDDEAQEFMKRNYSFTSTGK